MNADFSKLLLFHQPAFVNVEILMSDGGLVQTIPWPK